MAGIVDCYADVLDDKGERKRILIRFREDGRREPCLRDLDYLGEVSFVHGSLARTGACAECGHCKDEEPSEWLGRLKSRMKGST